MAYGRGTFITHNKTLPGSYANYVSGGRSPFAMSDRGVVALPLFIDWGPEEVYEVTKQEIMQDSMELFGYPYHALQMLPLRELVQADIVSAKIFRMTGETTRAECQLAGTAVFARAKYGGTRGSALKLSISPNVDEPELWDVKTYLDGELVDQQNRIASPAALTDNAWVEFVKTAEFLAVVGAPFTGGAAQATTLTAHQQAMDAFAVSGVNFHSLICPSGDPAVVAAYASYTKMQRDDFGKKFLLAAYKANDEATGTFADYLGVTSVNSKVQSLPTDLAEMPWLGEWSAVYWVGARLGAVPLTQGLEGNANAYNGELDIAADLKVPAMEKAIRNGQFVFHKNDDGQRVVLKDINSKITITDREGEEYQLNQVVRVCDQIAMDVADLFERRKLGNTPNDEQGRTIFQADLIDYLKDMERLRIVQQFDADTVEVLPGTHKEDVIVNLNGVNITAFMLKLYMTIYTV